MWSTEDMRRFAADGFLVARSVVPAAVVERARRQVGELLAESPFPPGHTGRYFSFLPAAAYPDLAVLLTGTPAFALARALTAPQELMIPAQIQVAWTVAPSCDDPTDGHVDGFWSPEPDGRPGTFTLLVGFVLTDQTRPRSGNLVIWPGTHRSVATLLRERGPEALLNTGGRPAVTHTAPFPIAAAPGDVIFCSYLLSHETGPHDAGDPRATIYFRLSVDGHANNWRSAITEEPSEFDAVRAAHRPDHDQAVRR